MKVSFSGVSSHTLQALTAGILATVGIIATTSTVSLQDIASLTNTRTASESRWLTHLVSIPAGSTFAASDETSRPVVKTEIKHVTGVRTAQTVHVLGAHNSLGTGQPFKINRVAKGDRVYVPKPKLNTLASAATNLINRESIAAYKNARHDESPLAQAHAFTKLAPVVKAKPVQIAALPANKLTQARNAAANKAAAVAKALKQPTVKTASVATLEEKLAPANKQLRTVTSAYAPPVTDNDTAMASAFAAVLRPSLKKEEVESNSNAMAVVKPAIPKRAIRKKVKRALIRLAKGDHKWAAKPLPGNAYTKEERRCLANGVYFEARGEPVAGQKAVAQVILNRVKNPSYPNTVCGVVYQNQRKRNACQFSFACDGKRDRVNSKKHWQRAVAVANDAIDGRFWLKSVGSSSHYHADYVWPKWRRKMRKMVKIGRHIFYRTYGGGWS